MIKFTLIIWVCSFLGNPAACLAPVEYPKLLKEIASTSFGTEIICFSVSVIS